MLKKILIVLFSFAFGTSQALGAKVKSYPLRGQNLINEGVPYYLTRTLVKLKGNIKLVRVVRWANKDKKDPPLSLQYAPAIDEPFELIYSGQADPHMAFRFDPVSLQSFTVETNGTIKFSDDQRVLTVNLTYDDKTGQIIRDTTQAAINVATMVAIAAAGPDEVTEQSVVATIPVETQDFDPLDIGVRSGTDWFVDLKDFNAGVNDRIKMAAETDHPGDAPKKVLSTLAFDMHFDPKGFYLQSDNNGADPEVVQTSTTTHGNNKKRMEKSGSDKNTPTTLPPPLQARIVQFGINSGESVADIYSASKHQREHAIEGLIYRTPVPMIVKVGVSIDAAPASIIYDTPKLFAQLGPLSVYPLSSSLFVKKTHGLQFNPVTGALTDITFTATSRGAEMAATAKDSTGYALDFLKSLPASFFSSAGAEIVKNLPSSGAAKSNDTGTTKNAK